MSKSRTFVVFSISALAVCMGALAPVVAQQRAMTAADYARAEQFMTYNVTPLVYRSGVRVVRGRHGCRLLRHHRHQAPGAHGQRRYKEDELSHPGFLRGEYVIFHVRSHAEAAE